MRNNKPYKQYIVRKYIMARDVKECLRKEKTTPPDEAWIDNDWKDDKGKQIGY